MKVSFLDLKFINSQYGDDCASCREGNCFWLVRGFRGGTFEREFAEFCGTNYCIDVANGLDALCLIFRA